jgi:hypothetical protein
VDAVHPEPVSGRGFPENREKYSEKSEKWAARDLSMVEKRSISRRFMRFSHFG